MDEGRRQIERNRWRNAANNGVGVPNGVDRDPGVHRFQRPDQADLVRMAATANGRPGVLDVENPVLGGVGLGFQPRVHDRTRAGKCQVERQAP